MDDSQSPVAEFDFRRPSAVASEVEQRMREWQESICRFILPRWQQYLSAPLTWSVAPLVTNRPARLEFGGEVVAFSVAILPRKETTLLIIPRSLAKAIVYLMLRLEISGLEDERPLTALEESALELAFRAFIEAALETQPVTPNCQLDAFHTKPDLQRCFRDVRDLVLARFKLSGPFGEEIIDWIWPETLVSELFLTPTDAQQSASTAKLLQEISQVLPFELTLRLGTTKLRLSELTQLAEGDLVLLDQRVSEPLQAFIGNMPYFTGWAGRVGNRQGLQVQQLLSKAQIGASK
jgi:flagellar motor switch protein FliM